MCLNRQAEKNELENEITELRKKVNDYANNIGELQTIIGNNDVHAKESIATITELNNKIAALGVR